MGKECAICLSTIDNNVLKAVNDNNSSHKYATGKGKYGKGFSVTQNPILSKKGNKTIKFTESEEKLCHLLKCDRQ